MLNKKREAIYDKSILPKTDVFSNVEELFHKNNFSTSDNDQNKYCTSIKQKLMN